MSSLPAPTAAGSDSPFSRLPRNWTASATISIDSRLLPCWSVHSRHSRRPSIATIAYGRHWGRKQHELRPPPHAIRVTLRLMRGDVCGLQVVEPPLHAAPVRPYEPSPVGLRARHSAPTHDRRQADDELLDRRREPRRARGVPEPERLALHCVHARLLTIITGRRAAACTARPSEQGVDDDPPRLGRQRLASWAIPATTTRSVFPRHRQRPEAPAETARKSERTDARGAAGASLCSRVRRSAQAGQDRPLSRGCRSVRIAATLGEDDICRRLSRSTE
jgi:hypothetical protein